MPDISCHGVTIAYVFQSSNVHWNAISLSSMKKMVEDREMYVLRELVALMGSRRAASKQQCLSARIANLGYGVDCCCSSWLLPPLLC
jgi:hypothetical protein